MFRAADGGAARRRANAEEQRNLRRLQTVEQVAARPQVNAEVQRKRRKAAV